MHKISDKIQYPFMIKKKKTLQKVVIDRAYLHIIKGVYDKPTTTIILHGEEQKAFSQR